MSRYLYFTARQRPVLLPGRDAQGRASLSCNFDLQAEGSVNVLEDDIETIFVNEGLATANTIFTGYDVPDLPGPLVSLLDTGGTSPQLTHDNRLTERPSLQVIVRAKDVNQARALSHNIYHFLHGKTIDLLIYTLN